MNSLNIGILAHVDAGKTSLTERLLFNAGAIETLGSVDKGNTQTDSMALEQKRGITIKSAVTSFDAGKRKVNLIDTPGHPDFIAEVERALSVLDAVILVISAVEGIQPQTRVIMRTLKKLRIPTLIFINKIDRMGARSDELVEDIRTKLFPDLLVMNTVTHIGTRQAQVADVLQEFPTPQIGTMRTCPIFFGSAMTGVGVPELIRALEVCLEPKGSHDLSLSGVVFKIERGTHDEKIAFVRLYSGQLHVRSTIQIHRVDTDGKSEPLKGKITAMQLFKSGTTIKTTTATQNDIVKVWGLANCRINDYIGQPPTHMPQAHFARPSLEVVIASVRPEDRVRLRTALRMMSEHDPLIFVCQNEHEGTLSVQLYGEVQKEVIQDILATDFHIDVEFKETTTICVERVDGTGEAVEIGKRQGPFLATIGLHIKPAPINTGVQFRVSTEVLGTMPAAFFKAVEDTVYETLRQGLYGWQVIDCIVTMTRTGYLPRQSHSHARFDKSMSSTGADFRGLTPLVLMAALKQAGTIVHEPLSCFELTVPTTVLAQTLQSLAIAEAKIERMPIPESGIVHIEGTIPVRRTIDFARGVPNLTQGDGTFTVEFGGYQKALGVAPSRSRADNNPLNREEYLRRIARRGAA